MNEVEEYSLLKCKMLVVKVASRCNINCTYCYMYNLGDTSYKKQPKVMSEDTVKALMQRVKEHCKQHQIKVFYFSLHGGEPLLAGKAFFESFVNEAKAALMPDVKPLFVVQTNGILLDDEWCQLIKKHNFKIGVSIDGTERAHDMYRLDHKGNGTYQQTIRGYNIAYNSPHLDCPPGVLTVINTAEDPIAIYKQFTQQNIRFIDLLYPEQTHSSLSEDKKTDISSTIIGDWLIKLFDHWYQDESKAIKIRYFESIIQLILGREISFDQLGTTSNSLLVIETDGSIEAVDVLKVCGENFTKAGMNVKDHSLDEALQTDLAIMYQLSQQRLCKKCMVCPVNEICGGGYIPHRYSHKNGFNNPSVYCADLMKLIAHIQNTIFNEFSEELREELGVAVVTLEDIQQEIAESMQIEAEPSYVGELEKFASVSE